MLASGATFYAFVSSVSVYADLSQEGVDEIGRLATIEDGTTEEITGETYGALKALCEHEVRSAYGDQSLIVRPGLIVGPFDPSDRFTYWPVRLASPGEVLAPGSPERPVQVIDARDLAEWLLLMCESRHPGIYNAVGPAVPLTFGELVSTCSEVASGGGPVTWVSEQFLLDAGVQPWSDVPMWLPEGGEYAGVDAVDGRRAWQDGLRTRPLQQTVEDTLEWHSTWPEGRAMRAGLSREREAELLEHSRSSQSLEAT
jgi:2'-hydroxyisoflavone reductase